VRVDDEIRRLVNAGAEETAIAAYAFQRHDTLALAARRLIESGVTSPEEALRVSRHEADDA
jgi:general secretion pathway protein E